MPAHRKLSGQYEGQCQKGVCVGGDDRGRGTPGTERCLWRVPTGLLEAEEAGGRVRQCECDIEFAPWRRACYRQCPTAGPEAICSLCDEIYESFQRSHGGQLSMREREKEREKQRERARRSRAYGRTCARCLLIRVSSPGTCSARFYTGVMSEWGRIIRIESYSRFFSKEKLLTFATHFQYLKYSWNFEISIITENIIISRCC